MINTDYIADAMHYATIAYSPADRPRLPRACMNAITSPGRGVFAWGNYVSLVRAGCGLDCKRLHFT